MTGILQVDSYGGYRVLAEKSGVTNCGLHDGTRNDRYKTFK
ncbi:hypothetical protein X768_22870 [Mesorhizobium sp. LSJC265A00]|nr:hypothetical protein X768_22870 [Mesorhizobium sp. LSJC265A00]